MTWSKEFFGTRHEIIAKINEEKFEENAHPIASVRQFIAGQLPTLEEEPIDMMQFKITAGGGASGSCGHRSNNIFVSVSKAGVKPEPKPEPPVEQHVEEPVDDAA